MNGASIVGGPSGQGCGGDRGGSVASAGGCAVWCQRRECGRWQQLASQHGTPAPQQQGGDRRSGRIEAHAGLILDAYETTPDITLAE